MNIQKLVAIVLSILINGAVLALFHVWSTAAVASAALPAQPAQTVLTLPTITVHPTRAQMDLLHPKAVPVSKKDAIQPLGSADTQALAMPYYSFEGAFGAADKG